MVAFAEEEVERETFLAEAVVMMRMGARVVVDTGAEEEEEAEEVLEAEVVVDAEEDELDVDADEEELGV